MPLHFKRKKEKKKKNSLPLGKLRTFALSPVTVTGFVVGNFIKTNSSIYLKFLIDVLYILASVWVLSTPNAGWNSHFQCFCCKKPKKCKKFAANFNKKQFFLFAPERWSTVQQLAKYEKYWTLSLHNQTKKYSRTEKQTSYQVMPYYSSPF